MVNILGMRRTRNCFSLKGINNVNSEARYGVNIQLYSMYSKFQDEVVCYMSPKITETVPAWYIEHDSWKLPTYPFHAFQGLPIPKRRICCLEQNLSFICFVQVVPNLEETELGWNLAGRIQHPGQPFIGAATSCLALE